jgi:hypothetical protein
MHAWPTLVAPKAETAAELWPYQPVNGLQRLTDRYGWKGNGNVKGNGGLSSITRWVICTDTNPTLATSQPYNGTPNCRPYGLSLHYHYSLQGRHRHSTVLEGEGVMDTRG